MATTIDDTPGTTRNEPVYSPVAERERISGARAPLDARYEEDLLVSVGPRVRWGGLFAGVVTACAIILILTMLGIAIGLSTFDESLFATNDTAQNFATTAGLWTAMTALMAYFVAGMVSTKVTDRPDGGSLLHGILVWMLLSMTLSWLVTSGIALGFGQVPGRLLPSTMQNATPANPQTLTEAELAQRLGLTDSAQLMAPASDERLISALVTATNMSRQEAEATLDDLRARVSSVQSDPAAVEAEIRAFLSHMLARVQQQAPAAAETSQRQIEKGSWMTFAVMIITLLVAIVGARAGLPHPHRWSRLVARR
jgi:uncharacterized protein YfcZ (UPF0381/DUF406 family)